MGEASEKDGDELLGATCSLRPPSGWRGDPPKPVGPAAIVIFGATGDLTKRKLIPSLYNLSSCGFVKDELAIVGVSRRDLSNDAFRGQIAEEMPEFATGKLFEPLTDAMLAKLSYVAGDFDDEKTYERLEAELARVERELGTGGNVLFYLATGPEHFGPIVEALGRHGLVRERDGQWRRIIVEKPFGHDLASAQELNRRILAVVDERQVFRIDHYLGKETVQNLMVFRFGNGIFEPIWNRRYVDNVQITVAESLGVEDRGGYYEDAGALRDMVPNHLLQLLALTAMEPPTSFEPEAVREERSKVLRAIGPLSPERVLTHTVRGQYDAGTVGGAAVPAYRDEPRVDEGSRTETFAALELSVDNWRWADVPFYLRTGKRLARRVSEISIQFRRAPLLLFRDTPVEHVSRNVLVIRVAPDEGISLRIGAKVPGPQVSLGTVAMDFRYRDHFGQTASTGYETLLWDCLRGDATLFQRADMIEAGWRVVDPVLDVWKALPPHDFPNYAAGSFGPDAAQALPARTGRTWRTPID